MEDKNLEEQGQSNSAENECEFDEIDIVSDPTESKISEINQESSLEGHSHVNERQKDVKSKPVKTFVTSKKKAGCLLNTAVDSGLFEDGEKLVKDEREFSNDNCLDKVQFTSMDEGVPDENDVYKRFYFESDHLALKENAE
jgi:hypothetical protein